MLRLIIWSFVAGFLMGTQSSLYRHAFWRTI